MKKEKKLIEYFNEIAQKAYVPYSNFHVVAYFENKDETSFSGINIENASYPNGLCAERVAIHSAINNGIDTKNVKTIHIYSPDSKDYLSPCGGCRQTISELVNNDVLIRMYNKEGKYIEEKFSKMFPYMVDQKNIKGEK